MNFSRCVSSMALGLIMVATASGTLAADSSSPAGLWKIVDKHTGMAQGFIRVFEQNGKFFGKLERSLNPSDATRICSACTDERRNQPIVGLVLMRNLKLEDGEYTGGDILDPDSGSIYRCKFRLEQDGTRLVIRGFIGVSLFGQSQTWYREQ